MVKKYIAICFILLTVARAHAADPIDSPPDATQKNSLAQGGVLSSYLNLKNAEHDASQNNFKESLEALKNVPDRDPWLFWKNTVKAETLLASGKSGEALLLLEKFPPEPDIENNKGMAFYRTLYHRALLAKKQALEKTGENAAAVGAKIWGLFPDIEPLPSLPTARPAIEDKIVRLHGLRYLKKANSIPLFLSALEIKNSELSPDQKCKALMDYGSALKETKPELALGGFSEASRICNEEIAPRVFYWKGRLEANSKKFDAAIATYEELAERFSHNRYTDDALHALMKIHQKKGSLQKASEARARLMAAKGDMKSQILWDNAYKAYKAKNYQQSLELLESILADGPLSDESYPQALYWKARTIEKTGKSEAKNIYRRLMNEFSFSFYAVLAANRLKLPPRVPSLSPLGEGVTSDPALKELTNVVDDFLKAGLRQEALDVLDYYSQSRPETIEKDKALWAALWLKSGNSHQTLMMAADELELNHTHPATNHPLAAGLYPMAYSQEITSASKKKSLPRWIIMGLMREESLFLSKVRSSAGAVGLMQLMPATARFQAKKDDPGGDLDLENSRTNILLGASFFKEMLGSFHNKLPLAVMAYNAGPGNARQWLRTRGNLPLDEFVEEIPFDETRGYVKRVMRSMAVYGVLMNDPAFKKHFFSMSLK